MNSEYHYADLSRMLVPPRFAVVCRTEEEIRSFHYNCVDQLGKFYEWSLDTILRIWNRNYESEERGFTLFLDNRTPNHMSWCNQKWFIDNGYEVANFADLVDPELSESDIDLIALLGL